MRRAALVFAGALSAAPIAGATVPVQAQPEGTGTVAEAPEAIPLSPEQEKLAAEIEGMLKCPVCRSQSVRSSRSFMAEDMSRRIRQMVAAGRTKEEIRDYFIERYGDYIVLAPRKEGFTWTVWLLPFALVLGGALAIVVVARRWKSRPPPAEARPPSPSSPYMERLERELEETQ